MVNKYIGIIGLAAIILSACSGKEVSEPKEETKAVEEVSTLEPEVEVKEEEPKEKTEEVEVEEANTEEPEKSVKSEITFAEFDKQFKRDPEEKEYLDGIFILKDGTTVNADYLSYADGEFFDYASAIFYNGKVAHMQIETSATIDEVEKGLGIEFGDNVRVDPYRFGYEIIFDETFADKNIERFPFELD